VPCSGAKGYSCSHAGRYPNVFASAGPRIERFDQTIAQRGFFYLLGLRLLGMPHMLVTAASALSPLRARSFALATLLGFLPAVTIAAMAGSAV
jgi:uncharacterized membrane protein YdjX (TVP38/TMEM64 family)